VIITPEADGDLRRLSRVRRVAWQHANQLLDQLEADPEAVGDTCDPPLIGCRRVHFWNDKYRLVWQVVDVDRVVYVIGCDLKSPTFYHRMAERFAGLVGL
jgi:mRNA-degrading endonuclease RelE of RelBE toxin-antitoxin system